MFPEPIDAAALLGPCVYALTLRGEIVYVGQSRKALSRLYTHASTYQAKLKGRPQLPWRARQARKFDGILLWPCPIVMLSAMEKDLIAHYRPKHNIHFAQARAAYDQRFEVDDRGIVQSPIVLLVNGHRITLNQPQEAPRAPPSPSGFVRRI
jgi:hypothetical protein